MAHPTNQSRLYFPPGGRLGLDLCDVLVPGGGQNQRSLISDDGKLSASIVEHPWFRARPAEPLWTRDPRTWQLDSESETGNGIVRRIWTKLTPDADLPLRELAFAHEGGIERLTLNCLRGRRAAQHVHNVIEQVLASAALRAPVSLDQFYAEHRFLLDSGALQATHFGSRLHLTLAKPAEPKDAWLGPRIMIDGPHGLDVGYDRRCGADEVETMIGEITWFSSAAPLALGDGNFIRTAAGIADNRSITVSAIFDTSTATTIETAMLDVMKNLRFTPIRKELGDETGRHGPGDDPTT
jgi:hypothetical protein